MRKAVIIPKAVVTKLGKGDHAGGAQLFDAFLESDPTPIDWHEGEDGDYIIRREDLRQCGKGCHR